MTLNRKEFIFALLLLSVAAIALGGCSSTSTEGVPADAAVSSEEQTSSQNDNKYSFYATVTETESDFGGILVESEDKSIASPIVVHSDNMPDLSVGDRVRVEHDGQITLSYPGQIFGANVTVAE